MYRKEFQGFVWDSIERDYLADVEDDEEYYSILEQYKEYTAKDCKEIGKSTDEILELAMEEVF